MECGKMQQIKMNLASDYVEDKGNKYNEVYIDLGGRPATYVSDIVVTGVPAPESGREYYYGDADGDRAITIADATTIQQQAVGLGEQYFEGFHVFHPFGYCDVNGDERLSILDVTCIQKYIAEFTSGAGRTGEKVVFDLPEEWYE
ncbi:MAG: dockerin type I repeat-containing protein, partial [Ruminococcus sp.]|nr:dockerin type I repeat-containing protein [Ruminococcus sp.]